MTSATVRTSSHAADRQAAAQRGRDAEDAALAHLSRAGLHLVQRNYVALQAGPGKQRGEIDLIMQTAEGTLVFVEVRARSGGNFGGALQSVTPSKQRKLVLAAQHYLQSLRNAPPCRFDVVLVQAGRVEWIESAFDAS
jgi:putative endonuclease